MEKSEYAERMKFEHELINRRLSWLLSSQTILFAAYGIALDERGERMFLTIVATTGEGIAVLSAIGIAAAFAAKYCTWQDFKNSGNPTEEFWVRTWITYTAFAPEIALPVIFAIVWGVLLLCNATLTWDKKR
ncbi:hypothetical protein LJR084_006801 [Variovorax sp. LjRoot84]|uniref:hypothetical protein n=1 Tax=Variovorax sp. LjRoot84 TaxID=3342340 RepID=UPI003ECEDA70